MKTPRRIALDVLLAVERGAYANLALKDAVADTSRQDAKFIYALVYTALDHQLYTDFLIDHYLRRPPHTAVRCVLRLGIAQLLYMNVPDRAACDQSVELVRSVGKGALGGLVNAILRNVAREKEALPQPWGSEQYRLSLELNWPLWLVEKLVARIGYERTAQVLSAQREAGVAFCPNTLAGEDVEAALTDRGVAFDRGRFVRDCLYADLGNVAKDPLFAEGAVLVQGEASMLAADIAGAKPGMRVLDACSAPGGKALRMAMRMREGRIDAWDVHAHRVALISKNAGRCRAGFIYPAVRDAAVFWPELEGAYDLVLADVPCSGLGVRGKPDIRYAKSSDGVSGLVDTQRRILDCCARYVKPGGMLTYVTCTFLDEENGRNFEWLLAEHRRFHPADIAPCLPDWFDRSRAEGGCVQLWPNDGIDGFFIAKAVRV